MKERILHIIKILFVLVPLLWWLNCPSGINTCINPSIRPSSHSTFFSFSCRSVHHCSIVVTWSRDGELPLSHTFSELRLDLRLGLKRLEIKLRLQNWDTWTIYIFYFFWHLNIKKMSDEFSIIPSCLTSCICWMWPQMTTALCLPAHQLLLLSLLSGPWQHTRIGQILGRLCTVRQHVNTPSTACRGSVHFKFRIILL